MWVFSFKADWLAQHNLDATCTKIGKRNGQAASCQISVQTSRAGWEGREASLSWKGWAASLCKHLSASIRVSRGGHLKNKPQTSPLAGGHLCKGPLSLPFHLDPRDKSRQARGTCYMQSCAGHIRELASGREDWTTEGSFTEQGVHTDLCGSTLPTLITEDKSAKPYRFEAVPIKIPAGYFGKIDKMIWKRIWKSKGSRIVKTIFKMSKVGRLALPDIKTYYEAAILRTVWCGRKERQIDR